ncbi:MAG: DedA family protein [Candidatus Aenigmarchaeota archaeon]|nr:DedA family protein [Candidatus Aenigmarchaeota archaeon]
MVVELIPLDWIPIVQLYGPLGLFVWNFISGSIIPLSNEIPIVGATAFLDPLTIFIYSTLGTWVGGLTNYYIGYKGINTWWAKRDPRAEAKAQKFFKKWGDILYLGASEIPFIGDPLLIVAGAAKADFKRFAVLTLVGKGIKVALFVLAGRLILGWFGVPIPIV